MSRVLLKNEKQINYTVSTAHNQYAKSARHSECHFIKYALSDRGVKYSEKK